jgi:hypothetical protein
MLTMVLIMSLVLLARKSLFVQHVEKDRNVFEDTSADLGQHQLALVSNLDRRSSPPLAAGQVVWVHYRRPTSHRFRRRQLSWQRYIEWYLADLLMIT